MTQHRIQCPHCGKPVELSEALSHEIEADLAKEFQTKLERLQKEHQQDLNTREEAARQKIKLERAKIEAKLKQEAAEEVSVQLADLKADLEAKAKKLAESQEQEVELRKRQRELEEKGKALELELIRKLDQEREKLREQFGKEFEDRYRLKDAEKDKQLEGMRRQIDDLKRKAEQGSQQTQGEVLELEMEEVLKREFPFDVIEPVPKGIRGADIIQTVKTQSGRECGKIVWEMKRAKNWSDGWITKLKDEQREIKASLAVLVSETLPPGFHHFREVKGVWVTDIPSALSLGLSLRVILIQVANARRAEQGKGEKMEEVYRYLTGPEFKNRVTAIVEAFSLMKQELDSEKRAMQKIWAKREKQIQRVIDNTVCMHGDLEAIAGNALPAIGVLELPGEEAGENAAASAGGDFG